MLGVRGGSGESERPVLGVLEAVGQARVGRVDQVVGDDQVENDRRHDVRRHDDQRGHRSDPHRVPAMVAADLHTSTMR